MMAVQWMAISMVVIILSSAQIEASRYRSVRQINADECLFPDIKMCDYVMCANGDCLEDKTTTECFKCRCPVGFAGKLCETPITTGCNPGCQNGGQCIGNMCQCSAGYSGLSCEVRDFCAPTNPCQNGGQCTSTGTNYVCNCAGTGHTGTICNELIPTDPCASRPCLNAGQCSSNGGTVTCTCINGYTGNFCQFVPIPCAAAPCLNGGNCQLTATNTYACVCPPTYTGIQCETSTALTHVCVINPSSVCQNGGTCTILGTDYLCKCPIGWSGNNCQIQETPTTCQSNTCGAHGTCIQAILPTGPAVHCVCETRWTGKYCDVNMDDCPIGFCQSGGTCRLNGNTPTCECPSTYSGTRCEIYIGPMTTTTTTLSTTTTRSPVTLTPGNCTTKPCSNGGSCFNSGNSFVCVCTPQYAGATCTMLRNATTTTTTTPGTGNSGCSPNPCSNGGSCFKHGNTYVCVCSSQYTGATCTVMKNTTTVQTTTPSTGATCANQPCLNGGSCYNSGNGYICLCGSNSSFTGKNCETPIATNCPLNCAPGFCVPTGGTPVPYACMCNGIINPTNCIIS